MKLKFKVQPYQTNAVEAVIDCFAGQPFNAGVNFRIDPGSKKQISMIDEIGFKNADLMITEAQVLHNIQEVQKRQNLPISSDIESFFEFDSNKKAKQKPSSYKAGARINLDIEMETGTGKTYCYIKSIFELNKRYGWNKFIIMVPSIAIREGVFKSLQITAEHFTESYGKKIRGA